MFSSAHPQSFEDLHRVLFGDCRLFWGLRLAELKVGLLGSLVGVSGPRCEERRTGRGKAAVLRVSRGR